MSRATALLSIPLTMAVLAAPTLPARCAEPAKPITVESLLDRMVNLRWLTQPPAAGERSVQYSSYDRASKLVDGKLVNPFANGDRGQYLRIEEQDGAKEFVLADADGPGYVSRIWSANPDGELRIYIDGASEPALAADFPKLTNGEIEPFTAPFGHDASRGRNLYFPFPFAKHIKVTTTKGDQYFQVNVTTYAPGTPVESYSPAVLKRAGAMLGGIAEALRRPLELSGRIQEGKGVTVEPASKGVLLSLDGPGCLDGLRLSIDSPERDLALARSLLTITFDGAAEPQVAVPVGDFFGTGPGINPFHTAVSEVRKDGTLTMRWPMPFHKKVVIELTNGGGKPLAATCLGAIDRSPVAADALTFHARWRLQDDIQTIAANGTREWPALRVKGTGRYVGLLLNVFNPTPAWWGEGDEKVYVDGEAFPSTFGTGTEDYFGYAWSNPKLYMNPFHAQTRCDGPGTMGNTSNVRYELLESIPFHKSIAFDMEIWHWEAVKVQYGSIAYFYAAPGATIEPGIPDLSARVLHDAKSAIRREPGAIEAEDLVVLTIGQDVPNQDMFSFGVKWSAARQLWWVCHKPDASLELAIPIFEAGTYDVSAAFTKAGDYGIAALSLDGKPLGTPIDLYATHPKVEHTGPVALGRVTVGEEAHVLTVKMIDKNPASSNYLFGMDWIKLVPVAK